MRRKELLLDFTSLLDVILILLFIVVGSMNESSLAAKKESEEAAAAYEAELGALQEANAELGQQNAGLRDDNAGLRDEFAGLVEQNEALEEKYNDLLDAYDYLKIITDYDADDTRVYQAAFGKTAKAVLECESMARDGGAEIRLSLYVSDGSGKRSLAGSASLVHDFSLSREERERLVAQQVTELTQFFSQTFRNEESPMIWFLVQYPYDDENITHSDLEIIRRAAENLERSFSKNCFIEEFRMY